MSHLNSVEIRKKLFQEYERLKRLPHDELAKTKRQRGRDFENILRDLLGLEDLDPEIRLRPDGEEIDGSFKLQTRYFLLEAKWTSAPQPASSIYAFQGKVQGKLEGTLGIFIAVNGFSPDCPDALVKGKALNIILFDGNDIEAALQSDVSFSSILESKLRMAAEYGVPFAPWKEIISKKAELSGFLPTLPTQSGNPAISTPANTPDPETLEIRDLNEFLLSIGTYIDAFARGAGLKELFVSSQALACVASDVQRHIQEHGNRTSPFKRAASFFICFVNHRPVHQNIPLEDSLAEIPNHQNSVLAFSIAIASLHEAELLSHSGTKLLRNKITVSKNFYFEFVRSYSNLAHPYEHIDTLALLFEQMAYRADRKS